MAAQNYTPHRTIVEAELQGAGNGWTSLGRDALVWPSGIRTSRGIKGGGINDLLAGPGTLQLLLDNDGRSNSARTDGYYSPDHPNCRPGFDYGTSIRARVESAPAGAPPVFVGKIDSIRPKGGKRGRKEVAVMAVDWMDDADAHKLTNLATQLDVRADQVLSTIVAAMPTAPPGGTSFDQGLDIYPFALDGARDEKTTALAEFGRVVRSERGFLFLKADGTLRFHNRQARIRETANLFTLRRTMIGLEIRRDRADIVNKVQATVHPRSVDSNQDKVLYTLNSTPFIPPGETITLLAPYTDPDIQAARVGATDLQSLVAGTDYTMHTGTEGGSVLTSNFTVTPTFGSNRAKLVITNNGAVGGYLTFLQIRGRALYDYEPVTVEAPDEDSIDEVGERTELIDLNYIDDPVAGLLRAKSALYLHGAGGSRVASVRFIANTDEHHMIAALTRDIGDRIGITESLLGLTDRDVDGKTLGYHIQAVDLEIYRRVMYCTWTLAPADRSAYWQMGVSGRSELGETTIVAPN